MREKEYPGNTRVNQWRRLDTDYPDVEQRPGGVCELQTTEVLYSDEIAAIERCRAGSAQAFEPIVQRYMKDSYYIALGLVGNHDDALELSQEAFYRAYKNLNLLKPQSRFFPWFYQILRNLCFSYLRRRKLRQAESLDQPCCEDCTVEVQDNSCFEPDVIVGDNEVKEKLWRAIGQLSEKHREVIILRHFRNYSYEQISDALHCSKGSVMSRLYHARRKLKQLLDERKEVSHYDL